MWAPDARLGGRRDVKSSRLRDRPCSYPGCGELVRRTSTLCRHHLGVVHGRASARTFGCSAECQRQHVRCPRCQALCNGGHVRKLRDGVCYQPGAPSCFSQLHASLDSKMECWIERMIT
jgi:hypothetical protein